MRRKSKRDSNEFILAESARKIGATVTFLNDPHIGDLLVGFNQKNYLIEVKTKTGKQRPGQIEFQAHWRGQYAIVRTEEELISLLTSDNK